MIATEGRTIRYCAMHLNCHYPSLSAILLSDAYSARAKEARILGAEANLDAALQALEAIPGGSDRAVVARQIAMEQHYRKRASFLDPRRYADKVSVGGAEDLPPLKSASDSELDAKIAALLAKSGMG